MAFFRPPATSFARARSPTRVPPIKIYDALPSPNCQKVRAVAYELDVNATFLPVDLLAGEQRAPSFVAINPNAAVPVLIDGDFVLWESNAIVGYLAHGTPLLPDRRRERAEVDRWNAWHLAHIGPAIWKVAFERYLKPVMKLGAPDDAAIEHGTADYRRLTEVLDRALADRDCVAGDLSVADFVLAPMYVLGARVGLATAEFPSVHAWLERLLARPSMKRTLA